MGYVAELQQFDDSITTVEPDAAPAPERRGHAPLGGEVPAEPPRRPSPRRGPAGFGPPRTVVAPRVPGKEGRPPWTRTEVGLAVAFVLVAAVAIVGGAYAVLMANRPSTGELALPLPSVEAAGERDTPVPTGGATAAGPGAEPSPDASPTPDPTPSTEDNGAPAGSASPTPEGTSAPPVPSDLAARYSRAANTGLLGLTGYRGKVAVTNRGQGPADGWTVTLSLPAGQSVDGVEGARARQEGELVTFTPVAGGGELGAGDSVEFTFEVPGLLAGEPTGCSINGRPCE